MADVIKNKIQWPTESGPSPVVEPVDKEEDAVIALQPQRIRLFEVVYSASIDETVYLQ